jgi:DNA-binding NarL/FixJ family response regulator
VIASSSDRVAGSTERPCVLLADDHQAMLALTADALASECLVVGRVGDGYELLAEAERLHPDVIVLGITMPRLDGIEAARQLRRSHRPFRLVFLTVPEYADYARAALDAGGLGYVVKARLASDLLPAIRASLADRLFHEPHGFRLRKIRTIVKALRPRSSPPKIHFHSAKKEDEHEDDYPPSPCSLLHLGHDIPASKAMKI